MFKGIYNVHFAGLQYSVLKIIPSMSKNRVRQSYLILIIDGLCEFFLTTPEIFAPDARLCRRCARRGRCARRSLFRYLRIDVIYHFFRITAAENIFVAILRSNEETIRSFAVKCIIPADAALAEDSPIAHIASGTEYPYCAHCWLEQLYANHFAHRYSFALEYAAHNNICGICLDVESSIKKCGNNRNEEYYQQCKKYRFLLHG